MTIQPDSIPASLAPPITSASVPTAPAPDEGSARESGARERMLFLDVFKGAAILAVVLIHTLSRFLRWTTPTSHTWYVIAISNRAAQFAVPGFLLISALLNVGSLLRNPALSRFFRSRVQSVFWPYLCWSAIFIGFQAWENPGWFHWSAAGQMLLRGTAYSHLYFLWALLQMLVALPLLMPILRRRPPFWAALLAALICTASFEELNRALVYRVPDLGRSILDYLPAVFLGLWIGSQPGRSRKILRRGWPAALLLTTAGAAIYFPLSIRADLLHLPVSAAAYQWGWWDYTTAGSFLLLYLAYRLERAGRISSGLQYLGRYSLQIYLAHPLVLIGLDQIIRLHRSAGLIGAFFVYYPCAIVAPLLFARVIERLRISAPLFGR
ncbi:MAG TPA: acyltransferase [Armatimonadota bacterium]|nr:acyltransferase [Armatimonadota bacterium]